MDRVPSHGCESIFINFIKEPHAMKYFISHSSKDKTAVEILVRSIKQYVLNTDERESIFCSSIPENGSNFKEELIININDNISQAENIILVITENYLRSSFCFYEMSLARYLKTPDKKIILIVQDESIVSRIDNIFPSKAFLHINAVFDNAADTLVKTLECTRGSVSSFTDFFCALNNEQTVVETPYIGMTRTAYDLKYKFIEKFGVEKICFDYPTTPDILSKKLSDASEIYFVSTTGSGFLKTYKNILSSCVANGCDFSLVMSDRNSLFNSDVADIEAFDAKKDYEQLKKNNEVRITCEFQATFQYLNEMFGAAHKNNAPGKICCASSYTLIRQTVFIAKKQNGNYWGWITCTMPPVRSADQTPSIVFEGNLDNILVNDVWKYATSLFALAKKKGGMTEIDGIHLPENLDSNFSQNNFEEMLKKAEKYWTDRYFAAQRYMSLCEERADRILIEVAAQHPLKKRIMPNKEFEARLNKAIELYNQYDNEGKEVMIYVPGSRHKFNGIADEISLSEAGVNYLRSKGIPEKCLLGEEANNRYKGKHGVYNSADECFVASEIFKNEEFEKLVCICSPNQIMRKTMLYIEFGCIPLCFGVTTEKMYHENMIEEIFGSLNCVLYVDHSWQDEKSPRFQYSRDTRKPQDE